MICPACRKPYYRYDTSTVTQASTAWPYCQCVFTLTTTANTTALTIHAWPGCSETGYGEIVAPGYHAVPQAFQDAFKDGELEL